MYSRPSRATAYGIAHGHTYTPRVAQDVSASHVCAACGSRQSPARHGGFAFLECGACGYAVLADGAADRADYWSALDVGHDYWTSARQNYFEGALTLLAGLAPGRRLIDIGGGVGFFAERALTAGWDAYSFDISPKVAQAAAERLGPARSLTELGEAEAASFDAACLWCVVAHTNDPVRSPRPPPKSFVRAASCG